MKKVIYMICLASVMSLSGCGSKESVDDDIAVEESNAAIESDINKDEHIDLTKLNATMLYARLVNIYDNPENFIGKTIKMKGQFSIATSKTTNQNYYYVTIYDEVMCCKAGVEFIWDDNSHKYPDEYPTEGQEIQIEGVFKSYEEEGEVFYYLDINDIEVI